MELNKNKLNNVKKVDNIHSIISLHRTISWSYFCRLWFKVREKVRSNFCHERNTCKMDKRQHAGFPYWGRGEYKKVLLREKWEIYYGYSQQRNATSIIPSGSKEQPSKNAIKLNVTASDVLLRNAVKNVINVNKRKYLSVYLCDMFTFQHDGENINQHAASSKCFFAIHILDSLRNKNSLYNLHQYILCNSSSFLTQTKNNIS